MLGGDPNDPSRLAEILKSMYVSGIDAGRAVRDSEARREGEHAFGAGFKMGFDEGKKRSSETMGKMADELLELRVKIKNNRSKPSSRKK